MIGSTIWIFDINRRVYPPREKGRVSGAPIWREHWRPVKITGETSRSWLTEYGEKVPKKGANPHFVAFTREEIDRAAWVQDNRYRIVREIEGISDHDTLRKIAEVIGYQPPSQSNGQEKT